jgi:hypothetical protein
MVSYKKTKNTRKPASKSRKRRRRGGDDVVEKFIDLEKGIREDPPEYGRTVSVRQNTSYDPLVAAEEGIAAPFGENLVGGKRRRKNTRRRRGSKRVKKHSNKTYKKKSIFEQLFGL